MEQRRPRALAAAIISAGALLAAWYAVACAVDYPEPIFSFRKHPDLPLTRFVGGRLGVLQPTFARSHLVIAWRWMDGIGMSPREREQAMSYYGDRQKGSLYDGWVKGVEDWTEQWHRMRASIRNPVAPKVSSVTDGQFAYDPDSHQFVLNCAEDAYRTAIHTLDSRRSRFGVGSVAFQSWLAAQDVVFSNCDGQQLSLPFDPTSELPLVIRQDRQYQVAAALFYAAHYPEALTRFRAIAADHSSPWSDISNYLVARTQYRMEKNEELKQEATRILADTSLAAIHGMTWNLVERAGLHKRDQTYFTQLASLLSARGQDDGFREELWNYTNLYDGIIGGADPNEEYWSGRNIAPPAEERFRSVPMTDWIYSFQARDAAAHARSIAMWKRTRSLPWLLAALTHATGKEQEAIALIDAAARVPLQSPGYLTASWHRIRLNAERGRKEESREELDAILSSPELNDLPSAVNLFRSLRMVSAADFPDFLHFTLRNPVLVVFDTNLGEVPDGRAAGYLRTAWNPRPSLDRDAVTLLNFSTPFDLIEQAVFSGGYPAELREEFAMTAFTRGLMLDRDLTRIADELESAKPELRPLIAQWRSAATREEKHFAAAFLLLRRPEARPYLEPGISRHSKPGSLDSYRDNWWCPVDIVQPLQREADERRLVRALPSPTFLDKDSDKTAAEIARLEKQGNAAEFLGGIVLSWAKEHPEDIRLPEALHRVVVATHVGCADTGTPEVSKAAFQALQRNYPQSEWAKRTPFWYREFSVRSSLRK
jgi:hypothetical protein